MTHSGFHFALHKNCRYQITFANFDLCIEYPPPYECLVWNYKQVDTHFIQRAINKFNWENAFSNIKIDKEVEIFNETFSKHI